jgi:hypothetical protein
MTSLKGRDEEGRRGGEDEREVERSGEKTTRSRSESGGREMGE